MRPSATGITITWQTDVGVHQGVGLPSNRRVRYEPYGVVGALARTSIIFPGDLGGAAGVLPAALGQDVAVEALSD